MSMKKLRGMRGINTWIGIYELRVEVPFLDVVKDDSSVFCLHSSLESTQQLAHSSQAAFRGDESTGTACAAHRLAKAQTNKTNYLHSFMTMRDKLDVHWQHSCWNYTFGPVTILRASIP